MAARRFVRLLMAGMLTLSLAAACTPAAPKPPLRVELWGDSISAQAGPYFNYFIGLSGKATGRTHTYGGTALCDWIPDIRNELNAANPAAFHPQAAVIQFFGAAFTPCMRDRNGVAYRGQALIDKYAADAAYVIGLFTRAGIPVYFVSTPISRAEAALGYVGNTPMGAMFSRLPVRYPARGLVRFADAAAAVEWHGHYSQTLPCLNWETCTGRWPDGTRTVVVRQADGIHFCPVTEVPIPGGGGLLQCPVNMPGAVRFVLAITGPILRDFRLS